MSDKCVTAQTGVLLLPVRVTISFTFVKVDVNLWNYFFIPRCALNPSSYEGHSKSSKLHAERKAIAEHFYCNNTLIFIKLEKLN